jgi:hypothetical protein
MKIGCWGPTWSPAENILTSVSPGVKQLGHEAEHSLPSSAEVKNVWSCNSTPQVMSSWCGT